jgi:hypothetical protein
MAEITREILIEKKNKFDTLTEQYNKQSEDLLKQAIACQGASQAIEELINELFPEMNGVVKAVTNE